MSSNSNGSGNGSGFGWIMPMIISTILGVVVTAISQLYSMANRHEGNIGQIEGTLKTFERTLNRIENKLDRIDPTK